MKSRLELDRGLARHGVVGSEPRDDFYGYIGSHPDRFGATGLKMELAVWGKSLLRNDRPMPFVIYGRPRSGTTLFVHLLDQIPGVRCDGELFHFLLLSPRGFARRLPKRAGPGVRAYGFKLLSYQLMDVQRIRRPLAFFDWIGGHGYSVVHINRNTWDQTISLAKAHASNVYFNKSGDTQVLRLDPARVLKLLKWNDDMLAYENEVMSYVPHLTIDYDRDLANASNQQYTIDRMCDYIGVPSAEVSARMRRTGGKEGLQQVENIEDLVAHVRRSPLSHLLPRELV